MLIIIYLFQLREDKIMGSLNERKIKCLAREREKPVHFCDISRFKGSLLGSEWLGDYPSDNRPAINFDTSRYF